MRIVSWNILDGGVGRADPIAEVLLAQRPDVVAAIEADDPAVLERLASRLQMTAVPAAGTGSHAVAVLTRLDVVETINHAALDDAGPRCLLEARLRDPASGQDWVVFLVHLSPRASIDDEARRLAELARLLEITRPLRDTETPHLLVGDFNSNSPIQQFNPACAHPRTREAFLANGNELPRQVVRHLLEEGYVDTLAVARGDEAGSLMSFTTRDPGQRVDYIFTWGIDPPRIREAWIEHDTLAKYASDHFPIGAAID
jgi:endonuclease/exonuclease/phosphatase family metal-dependent hydrolase